MREDYKGRCPSEVNFMVGSFGSHESHENRKAENGWARISFEPVERLTRGDCDRVESREIN